MSGVIAYHFWSPACGPCKVIKPAIEDLKEEFPDVLWRSVNTHDDINDASRTFSVSVVPTIVVTKNGTEVARHSGTNMSIYYSILRKAIAF
jgi:thiol-disulfide isomerase/thioredoxin